MVLCENALERCWRGERIPVYSESLESIKQSSRAFMDLRITRGGVWDAHNQQVCAEAWPCALCTPTTATNALAILLWRNGTSDSTRTQRSGLYLSYCPISKSVYLWPCLSYFSVAAMRYQDQGILEKEEFPWARGSGRVRVHSGNR